MTLLYKPFLGIVVNAIALFLLADIVEGLSYTGGIKFLILGGALLTVINLTIKPIIKLLSLPLALMSGGLIYVVINVGLLWFMGYFFDVLSYQDVALLFENWQSYVIGALVLGVLNWAQSLII